MTATRSKITELKDRVSSKTKKTYDSISNEISSRDKDYELVFTVRKHHLRH